MGEYQNYIQDTSFLKAVLFVLLPLITYLLFEIGSILFEDNDDDDNDGDTGLGIPALQGGTA